MDKFTYVLSPLNYIGGKKKILNQILPLFPKQISTFVDLFCGGCNVGINIKSDSIIFNDNLTYLIDLYRLFQKSNSYDIVQLIEERINKLQITSSNKDGFLKLRNEYNTRRNPLDLFILIAFSFNHQIRFNSSHQYNTPFGWNRSSFNQNMKDNLINFINELKSKNINFYDKDFKYFNFNELTCKDFVYADPPYLISKGPYNDGKRGFTGWNINEELSLLNILSSLNRNGIKFALSNILEHKGIKNYILKEWIDANNYTVHKIINNYNNSNYHTKNCDKGPTLEVLITNY